MERGNYTVGGKTKPGLEAGKKGLSDVLTCRRDCETRDNNSTKLCKVPKHTRAEGGQVQAMLAAT
jgi:hypothetical protein